MSQSQKTLEFLQKLKDRGVWNKGYDYSKVEYTTNVSKIKIICKEHGEFETKPSNHFKRGSGLRDLINVLYVRV